jgi:adenylate cyclase
MLECPRCQYANADGSRFCGGCGSSLIRDAPCSKCGHSNPAGQKFCNACGNCLEGSVPARGRDLGAYTPKHLADEILRSRSALEGERKLVTILFADVRSSTELSAQTGPEGWHGILDRFFRILADGVHRFEGTVNQYTGDGIMALFGAPIAHEDHTQRACYAALRLRDALRAYSDELRLSRGLDFAFRIGLNTGDVVVGKIGDDLRMDYTAQGLAVALAQRMEQIAAANSICLTASTARLASGYVDLRDLGPTTVKGLRDPIQVFELTGLAKHHTRLDVAKSRGLSRFVGRDAELATLEAALEQALAGRGQVVGVVAEAGTGKSRLCLEFVERCRARGISVDEGHCPAHGKTVAYLPVLELMRAIFDIGDRDGDHEARRKIAGELLLLDDSFQELLPLVFDFLGVGDPDRPAPLLAPEARQRQLAAFLRHLTQARSERETRVLLIDDAHWIDAGSDAFLAHAVEAANGTRTLWLINFRPEYHAEWMRKSFYRQVPLLPLGREATGELLADLLGRDPSLSGLADRIHERTRGNPFFIEELAQTLVEGGRLEGARGAYRLIAPVAELDLPRTVHAVLAARIDRLPEREKRLLQAASVIGKELPEPLLRRVAELPDAELSASLAALVQGEFLIEKALYPEAEYAFKHPLTHEVAYQSQLAERRARTHAAVARALEAFDADRLDERAALLAHHWDEAGEALLAARWHARAARWAGVDNPTEVLRHWSLVRALLASAEVSVEVAALRLEAACQLLGVEWRMGGDFSRARALLDEGLELAARTGDLRARVLLLINFATLHGTQGELLGGTAELDQAFELAMRSDDPELRFTVHEDKIDRLQFTGRLSEAAALGDRYVELGRALAPNSIVRGFMPVGWSLGRRAWVWLELGRLAAAEAALRESADAIRRSFGMEFLCYVECLLAKRAALVGDADAACLHARRGFDLAEKVGSHLSRVWAEEYLGVALGCAGDWNGAVAHLEACLRVARETRSWLTIEAEALAYLAEARLGTGETEAAQQTAEEAIETGRRRKTPVWEAQAHLALARVLLARFGGDAKDEIERALQSCHSLIVQTEARVWEPHVHELRGELSGRLGDQATREHELREAHRLFTEIGATGHAERMVGQLRSEEGNTS